MIPLPPRRIPRRPGAERLRPAYHFTARRGWLNDPNGLCFFKGEWQLFFQHNPTGLRWGNMHWGHAVSDDLLAWRELPIALTPDGSGTMFSGCAIVQRGPEFPGGERMVLAYTAAGSTSLRSLGRKTTQRLAFSSDGRSFEKYARNPVLGQLAPLNRDPKIIRHEPSGRWIMALYLKGPTFALFSSPDLLSWELLHEVELPGSGECPDFFPLALPDGGEAWALMAADGQYLLGSFDGRRFRPEAGPFASDTGPNFYAAQTFSDVPDGRRVQVGWMRGGSYPGEVFNQQMGIPTELSLVQTPEGPRIARRPARELDAASISANAAQDIALGPDPRAIASGEALDLELELEAGASEELAVDFRGLRLSWRPAEGLLGLGGRTARVGAGARLGLRALLDRASLEVFADGGLASMSACFVPREGAPEILASARGGSGGASVARLEARAIGERRPRAAG